MTEPQTHLGGVLERIRAEIEAPLRDDIKRLENERDKYRDEAHLLTVERDDAISQLRATKAEYEEYKALYAKRADDILALLDERNRLRRNLASLYRWATGEPLDNDPEWSDLSTDVAESLDATEPK